MQEKEVWRMEGWKQGRKEGKEKERESLFFFEASNKPGKQVKN